LLVDLIDKSTEGLPLHPAVAKTQLAQSKASKVKQSQAQIAQIKQLIEKHILAFYQKMALQGSLGSSESGVPG